MDGFLKLTNFHTEIQVQTRLGIDVLHQVFDLRTFRQMRNMILCFFFIICSYFDTIDDSLERK